MRIKNNEVYRTFLLLNKREKLKLILISISQVVVNFLDLVGVVLIGILGSLTVSGIQSKSAGTRVMDVLGFFKIDQLALQEQVAILSLLATSALVGRTVLSIFLTRKVLFFMSSIAAKISADSMAKILNNTIILMQSMTSQNMIYALTNGVNALTIGLLGTATTLLADISLLIILSSSLYIVSPSIALTSTLIFGFVAVVLFVLLQKRATSISSEFTKLSIEGNQKIFEIIVSFREIFTKNRQEYYGDSIRKNRYAFAKSSAEMAFLPHIGKYVIEITLILCTVIVSAIQLITLDASRAIASLTFFIAAGSRIAPAVLRIQQGLIALKTNLAQAKPILNLMDKLNSTENQQSNLPISRGTNKSFTPSIVVEKLTYSYLENSSFKLRDISVSIEPGQSLAIVGPSGSGKSTFADLIIGLLKPTSGTILISNLPPADAIKKWPGSISYVAQDAITIEGTIRDNICLGFDPRNIPDDLIIAAMEKAMLDSFVRGLPNGLDTQVGERGTKLSGGQRQRLAIARALLNNPKIIILDEATSSLDSLTENEINQTMESLKNSATLVIIAHRLSSVMNSNKIIYLSNGEQKALGNFNEVRKEVPDFDKQAKLMGI